MQEESLFSFIERHSMVSPSSRTRGVMFVRVMAISLLAPYTNGRASDRHASADPNAGIGRSEGCL